MKHAETVTFGGSGLNRAAELRGDDAAIARLANDPNSGAVVLWRGKPLCDGKAQRLAVLALDHDLLGLAGQPPVFLGIDADVGVFAFDISAWENPDADRDEVRTHHPMMPEGVDFVELRNIMADLTPREAELIASAKALFAWHDSHRYCAQCGEASQMAMQGWQRDCPACQSKHFPRTDPVVIMLITQGNNLLLGRSPGWPDGVYSLLAGFMEPGETIEAAVRREVMEEASITVGPVEYLASQPWPFPTTLMVGCKGEALDTEITLDENELEDAKWVSREDLAQSLSGDNPQLQPARRGSISHFLIRNWLADTLD